jgi:hypothetical protein
LKAIESESGQEFRFTLTLNKTGKQLLAKYH